MINRAALVLPIVVFFSGCAGLTPTIPPSAEFEPNSAYVAGLFDRTKGVNFAFVIRATDGGVEYVMPMGEDSTLPSAVNHSSVVIKIRPGTYSISQWITYATVTKEVMSRKSIGNSLFSKPFTVKAGEIIHLGNFAVGSNHHYAGFNGWTHQIQFDMQIQPVQVTTLDAQSALILAHPKLTSKPFNCLFFSDTPAFK